MTTAFLLDAARIAQHYARMDQQCHFHPLPSGSERDGSDGRGSRVASVRQRGRSIFFRHLSAPGVKP